MTRVFVRYKSPQPGTVWRSQTHTVLPSVCSSLGRQQQRRGQAGTECQGSPQSGDKASWTKQWHRDPLPRYQLMKQMSS